MLFFAKESEDLPYVRTLRQVDARCYGEYVLTEEGAWFSIKCTGNSAVTVRVSTKDEAGQFSPTFNSCHL